MHVCEKVCVTGRSCLLCLQLFARNADVDRVNDAELEALPGAAVGHAVLCCHAVHAGPAGGNPSHCLLPLWCFSDMRSY